MTIQYRVYRGFLKNQSEIKSIECCQANTTKIIDNILKNATLKREFDTSPGPDNWLFDIHYYPNWICVFSFDGRIKIEWAVR